MWLFDAFYMVKLEKTAIWCLSTLNGTKILQKSLNFCTNTKSRPFMSLSNILLSPKRHFHEVLISLSATETYWKGIKSDVWWCIDMIIWCNMEWMAQTGIFMILYFWVSRFSLAGYLFTATYASCNPYTKSSVFS